MYPLHAGTILLNLCVMKKKKNRGKSNKKSLYLFVYAAWLFLQCQMVLYMN